MVERELGAKPRALVVDDDEHVLRVHARVLTRGGYDVETAPDGQAAEQALQREHFDVILSDIDMGAMNGLELLERVRTYDLDVPVVLITGSPSIETAVKAIEQGALRYLVKPVDMQTLTKVANDAVRLHRIAKAKRKALDLAGGVDRLVGDHAGLVASFGRALTNLYVAYQPIVSWNRRTVFAYEALLRSREPMLPHASAILDAAERLERVHELGRTIRQRAIAPIERATGHLFINLHPNDLLDDMLFSKGGPFSNVADRVVLEITERASLGHISDVPSRILSLRNAGFRIALDDLGAGYAGLTSFALLEPDIVKLDMELVRNLHREPTKLAVVRTMIAMCKELDILLIAEGVETAEERDELARAGCDLMQGYLFARPDERFVEPVF